MLHRKSSPTLRRKQAISSKDERRGEKEPQKKIRDLERTLGRKTYELEIAGEALRGWE